MTIEERPFTSDATARTGYRRGADGFAERVPLPALRAADGEIIDFDLTVPVSPDQAGALLPRLQEAIKLAKRYEGFLEEVLVQEMASRGQTERRTGNIVWSYKPESSWRITNETSLAVLLEASAARDEITEMELEHAMEREVVVKFDNGVLNTLAKRVPEIEKYRERIDGAAKLKQKK